MRRLAVTLLCALTACRAGSLASTPTAFPTPIAHETETGLYTPAGLFFEGLDMLDASSGWAWQGLSQLYRTDDGGATWHEVHLQGKMQVTGASFLSGQDAYLPGVPDANLSQPVYHTRDGGRTWVKLGSVPGPNLELRFHDAARGWALNGMGAAGNIFYQIYQTTDGGLTWIQRKIAGRSRPDQGPMAGTLHLATGDSVAFTPPNTIWIASGAGISTPFAGLVVSRDGGTTWRDVNPALPTGLIKGQPPIVAGAPQFITDEDAYLPVTAGNRLVVFVTHDGGDSWASLPGILPSAQMMPRVQFVSTEDGFVVCGAGMCVTKDGGQTWRQVPAPFPFSSSGGAAFVWRFDFVDGLNGWAILMDQQAGSVLLKTSDGGRTWIRMAPHLGF